MRKGKALQLLIMFLILFSCIATTEDSPGSGVLDKFDVKHYHLDLNISNTSSRISGVITISSEVISKRLNSISLDMINNLGEFTYLDVDTVWVNDEILSYNHENDILKIKLDKSLRNGDDCVVKIKYHGYNRQAGKRNQLRFQPAAARLRRL